MPDYYYELRLGDVVVATGHLSRDDPFEIGERVEIGGRPSIVRVIYPQLVGRRARLVIQLIPPREE